MKIINAKFKNCSYPIYIGKKIFERLLELIESRKLPQNIFIVIDKNVEKHFGDFIKNCFGKYQARKYFYSFLASEKSKSFTELKKIYSTLLEKKFGRDSLIISIGGGVTGDLAAFAASTFMRGIQIIHVPTTLTACVDSSIGGKTAINFDYYKNIIGSFHQPQFVLCDTSFLQTLPEIELISGLGEIIKYALTTNNVLYKLVYENIDSILERKETVLAKIIKESINYKLSVVTQDEKELGLRKVLNFGHTFGHAFERELKNKIKHGEAVIAGISCANYLAYRKGLLTKKKLELYEKLLLKIKLNISLKSVNFERVYQNMFADKKNKNGQINFVLISDIGKILLDVHATKNEIVYSLKHGLNALNYKI